MIIDLIRNSVDNITKEIQIRIRKYGETVTGKTFIEYISIDSNHFNYIENLRLNNNDKYKELVYFSTVYDTLDVDTKQNAIAKFFGAA